VRVLGSEPGLPDAVAAPDDDRSMLTEGLANGEEV
jgi:hypothetical protein